MILTDTQELVRDTARSFARARLAPNARDWEATGTIPAEIFTEMGALGFLGMTVPEALGGAGLDYVSYALALMEIAAGDGGISTIMSVNNAPVCGILASRGSADQQARFLRPLAAGEMIGAFALTEPHAGSDAAAMRMRATRSERGYLLNGVKQFITSGRIAKVVITFIREKFSDEVQCVEMEGGAIAHVCTRFGVPFLILRALSDVPARGDGPLDFHAFLRRAAARSADICLELVKKLEGAEGL